MMAKYLHLGDSRLVKLRGQVNVNVFFKNHRLSFHMVALVLMTMTMMMMKKSGEKAEAYLILSGVIPASQLSVESFPPSASLTLVNLDLPRIF